MTASASRVANPEQNRSRMSSNAPSVCGSALTTSRFSLLPRTRLRPRVCSCPVRDAGAAAARPLRPHLRARLDRHSQLRPRIFPARAGSSPSEPACDPLGSDGTRTRDLRLDRRVGLNDERRRAALNRPICRVSSTARPRRVVEPILQPTFGPRVGHQILSSETTRMAALARIHCPGRTRYRECEYP
jgi:hypothetical protein